VPPPRGRSRISSPTGRRSEAEAQRVDLVLLRPSTRWSSASSSSRTEAPRDRLEKADAGRSSGSSRATGSGAIFPPHREHHLTPLRARLRPGPSGRAAQVRQLERLEIEEETDAQGSSRALPRLGHRVALTRWSARDFLPTPRRCEGARWLSIPGDHRGLALTGQAARQEGPRGWYSTYANPFYPDCDTTPRSSRRSRRSRCRARPSTPAASARSYEGHEVAPRHAERRRRLGRLRPAAATRDPHQVPFADHKP